MVWTTLSGLENLVEAFEGFGRKLTGQDKDRKRSDTAEDKIRENGIGISGGGTESGGVRFKRIDGLFDSGTLLVDIAEMLGASWDIAGIKAAVGVGSDIAGAAIRLGARIKASRKKIAFVIFKRERAKELESWSAIFTFAGAVELERLVGNLAERDTVGIEIGSVIELGCARIERNDCSLETALAEQEVVSGNVVESGIADKGITDKAWMAVEKGRNGWLESGEIGKVFIGQGVIGSGGVVKRKDVERNAERVSDNAEAVSVSKAAVDEGKADGAIGSGGGLGHIGIDIRVRVEIGVGLFEFFSFLDFSVYELRVILMNVGKNACGIENEGVGAFGVNVLAKRQNELNHIIEKCLDMLVKACHKPRELSFVGRNGKVAESGALGRNVDEND